MNKRIQFLFLFFTIVTVNVMKAENAKLDSLENCLKIHQTDDTVKVNLLNKIVWVAYSKNFEKARSCATQAGELSDKLMFQKGKAESLWVMGLSYNKSDKAKAVDYFQKALSKAKESNDKTGMVKYLTSLGNNYKSQNQDSTVIACFREAMKISEGEHDRLAMAKSLVSLSMIYKDEDNYIKAISGYENALKIAEEFGEKTLESICLNGLGVIHTYQGNYPQALECFHKYLETREKVNDKAGTFNGVNNIGNIYLLLSDYPKAFDYFGKALKIAEELKDKRRIAACYANIGSVYKKMNDLKSLEYFRKALAISEEIDAKQITISILIYLGDVYVQQNDLATALGSYQKALNLLEETGWKRPASEVYNKIGTIYLKQKKYDIALSSTLKGLDFANELKLMDSKNDIHKQLSEIYAATNDYKNAYFHYKQFTEINDSVYNEKNVKKITEIEYTNKFEKEKQAIESEQQKKDAVQRSILFSLIGGLILVLFFAAYVFRTSRIKHKTNLILTKQKHEIEQLNEEYLVTNEELVASNEALVETKQLVEESEERLKLLIKNSNDILVLVDENGKQFFISDVAENLTGYSVEELMGSIEDVIFPEDLIIVQQHWDRVLADKDVADSIQYRHKHKEKGYVWFEAVAQNFLDHPAIKAVVSNVRDITERKNIEIALQESEAVKAQLLTKEIERINRELEANQKSMTAATLKLIQNSERDAQLIDQLTEIGKFTNTDGLQKINSLISDNKRISYNSNWDEFEILFEKVHSSFYEKLNTLFPTLTTNERKMCAFLKLNMSNKDIAHITFQSDEALKKARLRLRQKFEMSRETNLASFLQNI
jgi:PAS domain S-box-containing protein